MAIPSGWKRPRPATLRFPAGLTATRQIAITEGALEGVNLCTPAE